MRPLTIAPTPTANSTVTYWVMRSSPATPTPRSDAVVVVGFGLEDAEREVLSWFDPRRGARIEWSAHLRRADVQRSSPAWVTGWAVLYDSWWSGYEERDVVLDSPGISLPIGDPVVVVVVSARGIEPLIVDGRPWVQEQAQPPAYWPNRYEVVAMFDGFTGERQVAIPHRSAHMSDSPAEFGLPAQLERVPTAHVEVRPAALVTRTPWPTPASEEYGDQLRAAAAPFATRTPTPTASPAPAAVRLTLANLPASLQATFRAYPLAPGSWRTWQWTRESGVVWGAALITQTVESAWLQGDVVVVESRVEREWQSEPREDETLFMERVMSVVEPFRYRETPVRLPSPDPRSPFVRDNVPLLEKLPWLYPTSLAFVGMGPVSVTTLAATFDNCWEVREINSASSGMSRWVCPEVGTAAYGFGDCAISHCSTVIAQLLRWSRAELPAE